MCHTWLHGAVADLKDAFSRLGPDAADIYRTWTPPRDSKNPALSFIEQFAPRARSQVLTAGDAHKGTIWRPAKCHLGESSMDEAVEWLMDNE